MKDLSQSDENTSGVIVENVIQNIPTAQSSAIIEDWMRNNFDNLLEESGNAVSQGKLSYLIPSSKLPAKELWQKICNLLVKEGFQSASICNDGITVNLSVEDKAA